MGDDLANLTDGEEEEEESDEENEIQAIHSFVKKNMNKINKKVNLIVDKIGLDISSFQADEDEDDYDVLNKKIDAVDNFVSVEACVKDLTKAMKGFNLLTKPTEQHHDKNPTDNVADLFKKSVSIEDISTNLNEFEHSVEDGGKIMCIVCVQKVSTYSNELEHDFTNRVQSQQFRNLKIHLKNHLNSQTHKESLKKANAMEELKTKEDQRNKKIGMVLGRLIYHLQKLGRPNTDFTPLVDILQKSGVDVGEINHSAEFVKKFSPVCASVVNSKIKEHLETRLPQTGQRPPVKIVCDKATWQHKTKQLTGVVTVVPDSEVPIQAFYLGAPNCPGGKGPELVKTTTDLTDLYIKSEQYLGSSTDGAYHTTHFGDHLDDHYDKKGHHDVDPLHKAGTQDTHMRMTNKNSPLFPGVDFAFLNSLTDVISRAFKLVNFGKEFFHFFDTIEELKKHLDDLQYRPPRFFSATRFANHVVKVYESFRETFPAMIRVLEEIQHDLRNATATEEKKKCANAASISNEIFNLKFGLTLSGVCDIYKVFSVGVNILQKVNSLPHVKHEKFKEGTLDVLGKMCEEVDPENCGKCKPAPDVDLTVDGANSSDDEGPLASSNSLPSPTRHTIDQEETTTEKDDLMKDEPKCLWPRLHEDIKLFKEKGEYRHVAMGQLTSEPVRTRVGGQEVNQSQLLGQEGIIGICIKRSSLVAKYLHENLSANVYNSEDLEMIKNIKVVLDLKGQMKKVQLRGASQVTQVSTAKFLESCNFIDPELFEKCDEEEMRMQYKRFLQQLEKISKVEGSKNFTSMDIFVLLLDTKGKRWENIEAVMDLLCRASLMKSVESVVESWVSVLEHHSSKVRGLGDDAVETEMMISVNGPKIQHCDSIVQESMKKYWRSSKMKNMEDGHFVRRSNNIQSWLTSSSVDRLNKATRLLPFM